MLVLTLSFISLFILPSGEQETKLKQLQELTTLPSLTNSTTFLEHRVAIYKDFSNRIYPSQKEHTYREFVYAE